jgi:hypothetical protein
MSLDLSVTSGTTAQVGFPTFTCLKLLMFDKLCETQTDGGANLSSNKLEFLLNHTPQATIIGRALWV